MVWKLPRALPEWGGSSHCLPAPGRDRPSLPPTPLLRAGEPCERGGHGGGQEPGTAPLSCGGSGPNRADPGRAEQNPTGPNPAVLC